MSNNLYDTLWVSKSASKEEIKKAYRKKAMQYHPDRNKWDQTAEKKFKEVNEAYSVLSDATKKQQYDTFWSTSQSWFWGGASSASWFWWFEDIFSWFWKQWNYQSSWSINFEDLFWGGYSSWRARGYDQAHAKKEPETLDFEKTYELPIFDLMLGCKIEVTWVYGTKAKLKIPFWTKPGTKMRVKWFGKKEANRSGNLIVKLQALMPKHISDVDLQMLERVRENIGY